MSRKKNMTAKENMVALTRHKIYSLDGELLEETKEGEPCAFLVGRQNVDPAYENLIIGKSRGFSARARIKFADPDPEGEWEEDREKFPPDGSDGSPVQGEVMHLEDDDGPLFVRVVYCDPYSLRLSTNDPLAGKEVEIDIELVGLVPATTREICLGFPEIVLS